MGFILQYLPMGSNTLLLSSKFDSLVSGTTSNPTLMSHMSTVKRFSPLTAYSSSDNGSLPFSSSSGTSTPRVSNGSPSFTLTSTKSRLFAHATQGSPSAPPPSTLLMYCFSVLYGRLSGESS